MSKTSYKVDDMLEDSRISRMEDKNKGARQENRNRPDNRNQNRIKTFNMVATKAQKHKATQKGFSEIWRL